MTLLLLLTLAHLTIWLTDLWDEEKRKKSSKEMWETEHSINWMKCEWMLCECCCCAISLAPLWFDLLIAWNWVKFRYYICNLIQLLFTITVLCYYQHRHHRFSEFPSTIINFSAVKLEREFHFTNISNPHTSTALFAYFCTFAVLFQAGKIKSWAWGITFITLRFSTL